jgi:RNA polymerase sigma-70 factor, ECF subfamily
MLSEQSVAVPNTTVDLRATIGSYQEALENVAYRITNNWENARDIVQDTYVTVLQSADSFNGRSSIKTYLYRIVINKCIDARRRQKRWLGFSETLGRELIWKQKTTESTADDINFVRRMLSSVPDKFRVPFILSEVDGLSYEEISETLQVSLNTVRTRIFRCREKLKKELSKTGRLS